MAVKQTGTGSRLVKFQRKATATHYHAATLLGYSATPASASDPGPLFSENRAGSLFHSSIQLVRGPIDQLFANHHQVHPSLQPGEHQLWTRSLQSTQQQDPSRIGRSASSHRLTERNGPRRISSVERPPPVPSPSMQAPRLVLTSLKFPGSGSPSSNLSLNSNARITTTIASFVPCCDTTQSFHALVSQHGFRSWVVEEKVDKRTRSLDLVVFPMNDLRHCSFLTPMHVQK